MTGVILYCCHLLNACDTYFCPRAVTIHTGNRNVTTGVDRGFDFTAKLSQNNCLCCLILFPVFLLQSVIMVVSKHFVLLGAKSVFIEVLFTCFSKVVFSFN